MLVEEAVGSVELALDPFEVGRAEPRLELERLDAEPRGEPFEQLARGNDLATLDLAHVLLREPSRRKPFLGHPGGLPQRANAIPDAGCRFDARLHHNPTARPPRLARSRLSMQDSAGSGSAGAGLEAAGVGFEPTDELPRQRFSRPPDSTALAPRRALSVCTHGVDSVEERRLVPPSVGSVVMDSAGAARELDGPEVPPSPFRSAFDRARNEALQGAGGPLSPDPQPRQGIQRFEYRLERRRGKRSADEADWNALGRKGWELVGVTRKHAAFKRPVV